MDEGHRIVAAARYETLVAHTLRGHPVEVRRLPKGIPDVDNIDFDLIEIRCTQCAWWDHWDERKGDITPA